MRVRNEIGCLFPCLIPCRFDLRCLHSLAKEYGSNQALGSPLHMQLSFQVLITILSLCSFEPTGGICVLFLELGYFPVFCDFPNVCR